MVAFGYINETHQTTLLPQYMSDQLECMFRECPRRPTAYYSKFLVNFNGRPTEYHFNVMRMLFLNADDDSDHDVQVKIRRIDVDNPVGYVRYFADGAWQSYSIADVNTVIVSKQSGHSEVTIHLGTGSYIVDHGRMIQRNLLTLYERPLQIECDCAAQRDVSAITIEDDNVMPMEFKCPITMLPMGIPVVASDGHTYEEAAIKTWLRMHSKSPVTNEELHSKRVVVNHALRKLMQDYKHQHQIKPRRSRRTKPHVTKS